MGRFLLLIFIVLGVFFQGCNFFGPPEAWEKREVHYKQIEKDQKIVADEIQKIVQSNKNECMSDSDCKVVGLGTVRCEHFKSYLVYSKLGLNESLLKSLISKFNENSKKLSDASFKAEHCGEAPKKVQCIQKICRVLE